MNVTLLDHTSILVCPSATTFANSPVCPPFSTLAFELDYPLGCVQYQAKKADDDAIADFPEIRLACILLLSKIAETSKNKPNSLPKHAFVDFLDVLLHAELFRLRVVEQVDLALNTWNAYFTTEKPEETLPTEDARKFDEIIKRKDEWRLIYFKILQKTIALVCLP